MPEPNPTRSEHTPGPWLIEYAETGVRWPCIYVEDEAWDGGRREIASLSSHVAKRTKDDKWRKTPEAAESEANARLIAAAPDLLAALQRISDLKDEAYETEPVSREVADVVARNAGRIARAAIAKAQAS